MRGILEYVFLQKNVMKLTLPFLILILLLSGCVDSNRNPETQLAEKTMNDSLATEQRIANYYGFENWKNVNELNFTFNIETRDRSIARSFSWNLKTDDVTMIKGGDTISYNRMATLDSITQYADRVFINDSYWLLAPFKLVLDKGTTFTSETDVIAPISKDTLNKLTVIYTGEGGYTPGDAYDIYYDENFAIREWGYRRENGETVSTLTSWEEEQTFQGIRLSTMHKDSTESFKLYFNEISIK